METDPKNGAANAAENAFEAAWTRALTDFSDDDAHRQFLAVAQSLGKLPEAGRRYRLELENAQDDTRRAQAQAQIDRLLILAMSTMGALKAPPDSGRTRVMLMWGAFALMLVLILGVTFVATRHMGGSPAP